jgi:hypothetical protein
LPAERAPAAGEAVRPAAATTSPASSETRLATEAVAAGRSLHKIYKAVAGAVAFISAVVGLLFVFDPNLRPTGDAPTQLAKLSELRVDHDATFATYLARIDQSPAGYTARQLGRRGALLDFRVRIEGFKGRTLLLKWELFDDASGKQLDESKAIRIRPTNATNEATWQYWIPLPHDRRRYHAIVALIEQKKTYQLDLASLETGKLQGLGAKHGDK